MSKDTRFARQSHRVLYPIIRFLSFIYTRVFLGYRCKDKYKIEKGKPIVVLSNHQTDQDPFCVFPSFVKPVYPVATDHIFAGKLRGRFFDYCSLIPKKKGVSDFRAAMKMKRMLENGISLLLFPEGNRYYAEFQFYIFPAITQFVESTHASIVLYNIHGGSGVSPRFKNKNRRGRFYGEIKKVLTYEQYSKMSKEELFSEIKDNLRVFDSESGEKYRSGKRAEYLERMLFCCPNCGSFETLYSEKEYVYCLKCGMKAEFREDLHFSGVPGFERLIDFWDYQKKKIRDMEIVPGQVIFSDEDVRLVEAVPYQKRKKLGKGSITLTDTVLTCCGHEFDLSRITAASVISGRNVTFVHDGTDYVIRGNKRFNPLKYVFAFNRLETPLKNSGLEKYYCVEDTE